MQIVDYTSAGTGRSEYMFLLQTNLLPSRLSQVKIALPSVKDTMLMVLPLQNCLSQQGHFGPFHIVFVLCTLV